MFSKPKNGGDSLREVIEEYIEDHNNGEDIDPTVALHEKMLISNILNLQDTSVVDVMIPRADIVAIDIESSQEDLMTLLEDKQFSRIPVYRENMDDILGTVHIKDILSVLAAKKEVQLKELLREVPVVSPALPVLDLMLLMQRQKKHMVLVIDEYGGIDGLVTVGDVIESIVGEIDDEFDQDIEPTLVQRSDGSILADARYDLDEFEESYGKIFTEEEREENDTLGGLVFFVAGRIPARGEVIQHENGMSFEIIDADQRRINKLRIKNLPAFDQS
ncbi:MAG: HlyC/CorC family transporter [Alphaproteobacteria bacterium]|nr:HlyC/CorC family transporter [Alphaproteobacteria bacterium]